MKPDEVALLLAVASRAGGPRPVGRAGARPGGEYVRDLVAELDMPWKWTKKGWYEYGVAMDLGWLTPAGLAAAAALTPPEGSG